MSSPKEIVTMTTAKKRERVFMDFSVEESDEPDPRICGVFYAA